MSILRLSFCAFFVISLFRLFLPAQGEPIQLGIEQSATIGPVAPPLQAGATFDEHNLPPLHTHVGWYMIPNWFAGLWHRETQTDKFGFLRTVTHQSRRDRMRGYQVDRLGRIWQAHDEPNVVIVDTGRTIDYILDRSAQPTTVQADLVVIRYIGSDIVVDKSSRRIVRSGQREEIQEIKQGPNGSLKCQSKLTRFDQNGNNIGTVSGAWEENLIRPFQPLDFYEGRNYFQDFCQYLQSNGLANAIPTRAPVYPQQSAQYQARPPSQYQQPQPQQQFQSQYQQPQPQQQFQSQYQQPPQQLSH